MAQIVIGANDTPLKVSAQIRTDNGQWAPMLTAKPVIIPPGNAHPFAFNGVAEGIRLIVEEIAVSP